MSLIGGVHESIENVLETVHLYSRFRNLALCCRVGLIQLHQHGTLTMTPAEFKTIRSGAWQSAAALGSRNSPTVLLIDDRALFALVHID